ncbi:MAG: hypothetical protein CMN31_18960 [Sandaracinus sp.]|nr:hypothetical protein [Sandaracinus sp.]MBJ73378.1 hypothetical protein [Sandaracinus sp.]
MPGGGGGGPASTVGGGPESTGAGPASVPGGGGGVPPSVPGGTQASVPGVGVVPPSISRMSSAGRLESFPVQPATTRRRAGASPARSRAWRGDEVYTMCAIIPLEPRRDPQKYAKGLRIFRNKNGFLAPLLEFWNPPRVYYNVCVLTWGHPSRDGRASCRGRGTSLISSARPRQSGGWPTTSSWDPTSS